MDVSRCQLIIHSIVFVVLRQICACRLKMCWSANNAIAGDFKSYNCVAMCIPVQTQSISSSELSNTEAKNISSSESSSKETNHMSSSESPKYEAENSLSSESYTQGANNTSSPESSITESLTPPGRRRPIPAVPPTHRAPQTLPLTCDQYCTRL